MTQHINTTLLSHDKHLVCMNKNY